MKSVLAICLWGYVVAESEANNKITKMADEIEFYNLV